VIRNLRDLGFHRRRQRGSTDESAEVVVGEVQREHRFEVVPFLALDIFPSQFKDRALHSPNTIDA
jgi:hypothetical protein